MQRKQDNYSNTFKVKHTQTAISRANVKLQSRKGCTKSVQFGVQFSFHFNRSEAKRDETKRKNVAADDGKTYAGLDQESVYPVL